MEELGKPKTCDVVLTERLVRNFWAKIEMGSPSQCWPWTGWRNTEGYGRFDAGDRKFLATRLALILSGRPEPPAPNNYALHADECSNPQCCNPSHLRWGSPKENSADRDRLGRRTAAKGEAHGCAKLTADLVRWIRSTDKPTRAIARDLGVSQAAVKHVRQGKTWTHVT